MAEALYRSSARHAVLVHGADAAWRRAVRHALLALASGSASTAASTRAASEPSPTVAESAEPSSAEQPLTVLLSSRESEAAKWFADPRLSVIVARDNDAAFRRALGSLAATLPVLWVSAVDADAASVQIIARDALALLSSLTRRL